MPNNQNANAEKMIRGPEKIKMRTTRRSSARCALCARCNAEQIQRIVVDCVPTVCPLAIFSSLSIYLMHATITDGWLVVFSVAVPVICIMNYKTCELPPCNDG